VRVSSRDMIAFFKSMWKIGILSRSRFRYWWLIIKTALFKRKHFPVAVESAIFLVHFEKIAKRIRSA